MMSKILQASDGRRVRYLEAGKGAPLVLFHGVGMRAEAWTPQLEALSATSRVIAVDLPGHGQSDPLEGMPALSAYTLWASQVLRALNVGPAAVAGHSMGALISLGLSVEFPDWVSRVCLLNPVYRRSPEAATAVRARAAALGDGDMRHEAALDRWFPSDEHPEMRAQVADWLDHVDPEGYLQAYTAFSTGDTVYADGLSRIDIPALIITGEFDGNSTPGMSHQIAQAIGRARSVVIRGGRHMVSLTDPKPVNREMEVWLADRRQDSPLTAPDLQWADETAK